MKKLFLIMAALSLGCSAMAQQNLRTSYFMDTYAYSYRLNPSFIPRNGHVSIGIGNISVGVESNVPGTDMITYNPSDRNYITFLDEEHSGLTNDVNRINANAYVDLFSLGFHKKGWFHSIDLGLKADVAARVPGSLFNILKSDLENEHAEYHLRNFALNGTGNLELAYGLATRVGDRLSVGGRLKLQYGIANVRGIIRSADVFVNDNIIDAKTDGFVELNLPKALAYGEKDGKLDVDDYDTDPTAGEIILHPAGFGVAVDLGASMEVADGLTVSLAVNDLGLMKYGTSQRIAPGNFIVDTDESDSEYEDSDEEKFLDNTPLTLVKTNGTSALKATVVAGVEYAIPGAKGLSAGFVGTARMAGLSSWAEGRVVMNYVAPKVLEVAVSGAMSSFGPSAGFALSLDLGPFNLFTGLDSFIPLATMGEGHIPTSKINTNLSFGLSIIWGRNRVRQ